MAKETGEDILRTIAQKGGGKGREQAAAELGSQPASEPKKTSPVVEKVKNAPNSKPGMLGKTDSMLRKGVKGALKIGAAGALGLGGLIAKGTVEELGVAPFIEAGAAGYAATSGRGGGSNKGGGSSSGSSSGGGSGGGISGLAGILTQMISIESNVLSAIQSGNSKLDDINAAVDRQTQEFIGQTRMTNDLLKQLNASILGSSSGGKSGSDKGAGGTDWLGILKGVGLALAATLGGILGFLKGYLRPLEEFGKFLASTFEKLFKGLGTVAEDAIGMFKSIFSGEGVAGKIGKVFTTIVDAVKDFLAPLEKVGTFLSDIFAKTGELLKAVVEPFVSAFKYIGSLVEGAGEFAGTIGKFMPFLEKLVGVFSFALKWMEPIGWIVMAIQGAYEAITGAIEGYKEGGIVGAIGGAVKGLFDSLIAAPLDLIKDFVSWMLELFGWDSASKALDSFSFQKSFDDLIDGIANMVKSVINTIYGFFTSIPGKLMDLVGSTIPDALKGAWNAVFGSSSGEKAASSTPPPPPPVPYAGLSQKVLQQKLKKGEITEEQFTAALYAPPPAAAPSPAAANTSSKALSPYDKSSENIVDMLNLIDQYVKKGTILPDDAKKAKQLIRDGNIDQAKKLINAAVDNNKSAETNNKPAETTPNVKSTTPYAPGVKSSSNNTSIDPMIAEDLTNRLETMHTAGTINDKLYKTVLDYIKNGNENEATKIITQAENSVTPAGNITLDKSGVSVTPVPNNSASTLNQQSSQMAVQNAAPAQAPVVINNNNNAAPSAGASPPPPPRTSGAVMTAPVPSHIDRTLYGDMFGAGVF